MASSSASRAERRRAFGRAAAFAAFVATVAGMPGSLAPVAVAGDAAATDLSALLAGMRSSPGVVARFTETRELALLSSPLEAAGTIYFVPPSRLVRIVTKPGRSRLVVDGDKVRIGAERPC